MKIHEEQMGSGGDRSDLSNAHPNVFPQNLAHWYISSAVLQILICAAAYLKCPTHLLLLIRVLAPKKTFYSTVSE